MTTSGPVIQRQMSGGLAFISAGNGSKPPIVLLHGIGSNAASYTALMAALAPNRRTVAWDAPGYGRSEPFSIDWPSADDYAESLHSLLDRLGLGTIILLGHSMGAVIAGRFAARFPERLTGLILGSPALGYGTAKGDPLGAPAAARLEAMISEGAPQFAASRGPRLVFEPDQHPKITAAVVAAMSEVKLPGYQHSSRMLSCGDLLRDTANIRCRTLVFVGKGDVITPPANCKRVYDGLVQSNNNLGHTFTEISECGHALVQEKPHEIAALIDGFAASLDV